VPDAAQTWERFAQTDPEFYVAHRWVGDRMLAQASERLSDRAITWSPILDGRLPCESGRYDFVFCYDVIQHIPDPETIRTSLHETRRVLTPEGRAVLHFDTQRRPAVRTLVYRLPDAMLPRARRRYARRYPLRSEEPRAMAEAAGLRVLDERHIGTPFHHLALAVEN
jgi:ubiquinone/menaquinone biosynthesis C-methylase UbiE